MDLLTGGKTRPYNSSPQCIIHPSSLMKITLLLKVQLTQFTVSETTALGPRWAGDIVGRHWWRHAGCYSPGHAEHGNQGNVDLHRSLRRLTTLGETGSGSMFIEHIIKMEIKNKSRNRYENIKDRISELENWSVKSFFSVETLHGKAHETYWSRRISIAKHLSGHQQRSASTLENRMTLKIDVSSTQRHTAAYVTWA